ncbi:hypothetical protein L7F22_062006 [Adiantum nelumboides]|nr:hypothetical protein [Adiantum nelumboides]
MQARQDWGIGMLELQPHKGAKKGKSVHIDLRDGKHESLDLETSVDEFSSFDYSTLEEESTVTDESDSSQAEIMGVVLTKPAMVSLINISQVGEGKLAKMLAKDLTQEERQAYLTMLEGYPKLFIDDYDQIVGVSMMQHHINLKDGAKPVVQWLRRLGVVQQNALLSKLRKLLNVGFIYLVEDSEWVSPIVVTPKKNGKWRVCGDYKPLNVATKRDHFPLPFQDEILNKVAGYERFSLDACVAWMKDKSVSFVFNFVHNSAPRIAMLTAMRQAFVLPPLLRELRLKTLSYEIVVNTMLSKQSPLTKREKLFIIETFEQEFIPKIQEIAKVVNSASRSNHLKVKLMAAFLVKRFEEVQKAVEKFQNQIEKLNKFKGDEMEKKSNETIGIRVNLFKRINWNACAARDEMEKKSNETIGIRVNLFKRINWNACAASNKKGNTKYYETFKTRWC